MSNAGEDAKVVRLPVTTFKVHSAQEPRKPLTDFGKLARRHGDAFDRALDSSESLRRTFVCDSLKVELASKITHLAEQAYALAEIAKRYSEIATSANLRHEAESLQSAQKRDQRRPRSDPHEWNVTQLAAEPANVISETDQEKG